MELFNFVNHLNSYVYSEDMKVYFRKAFAIKQLHALRRVKKWERNFWNHFWRSWNFCEIKDAAIQAYQDMAENPEITKTELLWRFAPNSKYNFERLVTYDQNKFVSFLRCWILNNELEEWHLSRSSLLLQLQKLVDWNFSKGVDIIEEEFKTDISIHAIKREEKEIKETTEVESLLEKLENGKAERVEIKEAECLLEKLKEKEKKKEEKDDVVQRLERLKNDPSAWIEIDKAREKARLEKISKKKKMKK